jgi:polyisoprenyl-phosphate glycosyltransferase
MTAAKKLISVIAPVYGCTNCLEALVDAVRDAFANTELDWELILVDDRGPDDPWPLIQELASLDSRVRGTQLMRNHGQHLAIWAGLEKARGSWVAVIDCDLQDDPVIIPALYAEAQTTGADAVMVNRGDWSDGQFRRWASRNFYKVMTLFSGVYLEPNIGNFGLYSRRLVNVLLSFRDAEVFLPAMVAMTGLPRSYLTLDRSDRHAGHSTYNLKRLIRLSIAMIIRFSDRPLKISVLLGLSFSFFSVLISAILVVVWAFGIFTVPGWTSLILSLWFLAGLILSVLGVHGFYIGRIFAEVKRRPRIMVARSTDDSESDEAA